MIFIKDEEFIRGNCPMTKEEIRILSIAKLQLNDDHIVLDIGAGTGSVSIQMCKCCSNGEVIAIEKDKEALHVLMQNKEKFKVSNLSVLEGEAVAIESRINKTFDAVFIGGSGGNIENIIRKYSLKLKISGKIVLNLITLDNLYKAMNVLKELDFDVECCQVSVSKTRENTYMLFGSNPIFIVTGRKKMEGQNG